MEKHIIITLFLCVVSLLGTLLGSALGLLFKKPTKGLMSVMIGLSGGLMMSVVVFDLLPESLLKTNFANVLGSIILGIAIIFFGDTILKGNKSVIKDATRQMALLTAVGLMIHNLPEGIIMGCGFAAGKSLGLKMCILISVHDIPEGLAVTAPMIVSGMDPLKTFLYTAVTALPTAVGVIIGIFVGNISQRILGLSLGLASGIMIYVVLFSMIPEAIKLKDGLEARFGILSGVMIGFIMCTVL
ncbi:MAG: ZIP family metal transporter [Clostridium sp.]|nr:ZIP family metal transporter [Clostridium sp.]